MLRKNMLLQSATSIGANYEEATSKDASADFFIYKIQISVTEIRESDYGLALSSEGGIVTGDQAYLPGLPDNSVRDLPFQFID